MSYCKKCFEHIRNDCMLENNLCVFCYYKIDQWDSNGRIVSKSEAIQDWFQAFGVWRQECLSYYKDIKEAIALLPKGSLIKKKIKRYVYYYLVWRENKKVRFLYQGSKLPTELDAQIRNRKELTTKLQKLRPLLYPLRTVSRPVP